MLKKYEIIHHKDFHRVQLQGLKIKERNIFMALSFKAMNQESNLLEFDVNEIAKISNYTPTKAGDNIYKYLRETYNSLKNITIQIDKTDGFKDFILFTGIESFESTGKVQFKVNEDYKYLLNNVMKPYTIQNLFEYNKLTSKYSQLVYSMLKEWEGAKEKEFIIDDFKQRLGIEKYRMSEIDKRVFKAILKELPKYFYNLKIEKIKEGRKITKIKFTWQTQLEPLPMIEFLEAEPDTKMPVCAADDHLSCAVSGDGLLGADGQQRCQPREVLLLPLPDQPIQLHEQEPHHPT